MTTLCVVTVTVTGDFSMNEYEQTAWVQPAEEFSKALYWTLYTLINTTIGNYPAPHRLDSQKLPGTRFLPLE